MKHLIDTPTPGPLTWQDIMIEFDMASAAEIRCGFAKLQAERRAEALAKNPAATPEEVAAARAAVERAETLQANAESVTFEIGGVALRYRPANLTELWAKYAHLLKIYGGELDADDRFRDFAHDLERFAEDHRVCEARSGRPAEAAEVRA